MVEKVDLVHKYNWKERTEEHNGFYQTKEYRMLREEVRIRDQYLCQWCLDQGLIQGGVVCHHIVEVSDGERGWSLRLDLDNCVLICNECHAKAHNRHGGISKLEMINERNKQIAFNGAATMSDFWEVILDDG